VFGFLRRFCLKPFVVPEEVTTRLAQIEAGKQRILCASDVYEQVRDTVYGAGYGLHFKVLECRWMDDGQVVVMPSEAEEQVDLQRAERQVMDEILERWARDQRAADESRRWHGATAYQPGPFSPIITGI
jgi:hypothetical protein